MSTEPVKVLADIIQTFMDLEDGQVVLAYQKFTIPTDGLLVVLTSVNDQEISRDSFLRANDAGGQDEVNQIVMLHEVQVDILSFDNAARTRRLEIPMAIGSFYSEQEQEANSLQIARNMIPMQDTSFLEVTKYLSRYTTRIRMTALTELVKSNAEYYDDFSRAVPPVVAADA